MLTEISLLVIRIGLLSQSWASILQGNVNNVNIVGKCLPTKDQSTKKID